MAHNNEYRVIRAASEAELNTKLGQIVSDGWKPILISSVLASTSLGPQIVTMVIIEREKGGSVEVRRIGTTGLSVFESQDK